METLFSNGQVAYIVIAVMAFELWLLRSHIRRMPVIAYGLGAGVFLVLALRSALLDHSWVFIATFLSASFICHLLEVRTCLRLEKILHR